MRRFTKDHIFILPHAEEYRLLYGITIDELLLTLNAPDTHEGLAEDHYTSEKAFPTHRVYVYYYLTLPLQGERDEAYAIVDFIGYTPSEGETQRTGKNGHGSEDAPKPEGLKTADKNLRCYECEGVIAKNTLYLRKDLHKQHYPACPNLK